MKKQSILCVDDEKFVLNSLKEQLKTKFENKYTIELAESGEDALEILKELTDENTEIPLVISDYIMPGMKGDELLKIIHKLYPKTINILLTGQATLGGVINAINGANLYRYITKPWEIEDLSLAVFEAIKSYEKDKKIEHQNDRLQEQNAELLIWTEAFVEAMGTVLDTRDTTTSGHSKRIAKYAEKTAKAINRVSYGKYRNYKFTNDEIKELYYSALLHDIGKIGIREQILLKQRRVTLDRQDVICYRLNWYIERLKLEDNSRKLNETKNTLLNKLPYYITFLIEMNKKEFISDEEIVKIKEIAALRFIDIDGVEKNLLDEFEIENLTVKKGNLTIAERSTVCSHVEYTYNILKGIPWPKYLEGVPEIAASHHERLNGTGYYRGLQGDEISTASRILAILDVYEALTSPDRPYKEKKTVEEALTILEWEVREGNLDEDIFEVFVKEKIYE